jgi:hypothetical protein
MTDQTPAEFRTEINVRSLNPFSIIIPTMQLTVEQETEMHLDILDDGEWVNLKTKRIVRGGAPPPWISDPNASAPPA